MYFLAFLAHLPKKKVMQNLSLSFCVIHWMALSSLWNTIQYLQHERPCCIGIYKLKPKAGVVDLIQHGREGCKWLVKLSNFIDLFAKKFWKYIIYKTRKSKLKFIKINRILYQVYRLLHAYNFLCVFFFEFYKFEYIIVYIIWVYIDKLAFEAQFLCVFKNIP